METISTRVQDKDNVRKLEQDDWYGNLRNGADGRGIRGGERRGKRGGNRRRGAKGVWDIHDNRWESNSVWEVFATTEPQKLVEPSKTFISQQEHSISKVVMPTGIPEDTKQLNRSQFHQKHPILYHWAQAYKQCIDKEQVPG